MLCIALRKKRLPSGSLIRWLTGSSGAVRTNSPSLNQSIWGWGFPDALQLSVTGSFRATVMANGCSVINGGDEDEPPPAGDDSCGGGGLTTADDDDDSTANKKK